MVLLEAAARQLGEKRDPDSVAVEQELILMSLPGKGCMLSLISCDEEMEKYISPVSGYGYVI